MPDWKEFYHDGSRDRLRVTHPAPKAILASHGEGDQYYDADFNAFIKLLLVTVFVGT